MAFWGAPIADEEHSVHCVEAAIEAHRSIHRMNQDRIRENNRREADNQVREAAGLDPLPMLPILSLGTGINTGEAIVGLMGSEDHILNYTVFGRDVNVASRLESVSGRGRIIIGETTFQHLERFRPELAERCERLPAVTVKGIRMPVQIYEMPWKAQVLELPTSPPKDDQAEAA